ncbi:hypothetical protein DPMN_021949 [Dreissena polymorpha]|uniref:Uncharacterized protein n=1 Tax=Dreissena polymorpha TaxID=45954 RepID=A0A9D4NPQ0_DREPO|nr:hypothetical protein DPMN_021949 [Dreissena polymorpha]
MFSDALIIPFGVAFAITRLTYGLVEVYTTLCPLENYIAIILATKGGIALLMFWAPLVVFRCFDMVERASINPCFEIYVYAFTLTEFVLLVSGIVWCLGDYRDMKSTCHLTDPNWSVHFANFVISQTIIDTRGRVPEAATERYVCDLTIPMCFPKLSECQLQTRDKIVTKPDVAALASQEK